MAEQNSINTIQPNIKEGDSWFMICAEEEQLPCPKSEPKDEELLPIEVHEAAIKRRHQAIAEGKLPETTLQSLDGYTVWRKYHFMVERSIKGKNSGLTVSVAFVGYHEVPSHILEKYNLPVCAEPQSKLRYFFDQHGALSEVTIAETNETILINGRTMLLDWDVILFPAGFPSSFVIPEDNSRGFVQAVRVDQGFVKVWLGNALDEIDPPQSDPGIEYEIQYWHKGAKWWDEAYVVRDGYVTLTARTIQ